MTWRDPNLICNIYIESINGAIAAATTTTTICWTYGCTLDATCSLVYLHASFAFTFQKSMGFVARRYFQCGKFAYRKDKRWKQKSGRKEMYV